MVLQVVVVIFGADQPFQAENASASTHPHVVPYPTDV